MEGEIIKADAPELTMAQQQTQAEVDIQVSTARRYPRSIKQFLQDARTMAVQLDKDTAASMFYSLRRGGNVIEGPSARLAEVAASAWGHMRCEARVVGEDGDFIVAQGIAWDMQRNVLISREVKRRITDRSGNRYSADMIAMTANAAASIALRNAVFSVIPRAYVDQLYKEARATAVGDAKTLKESARGAIDWFVKAGATDEQVFAHLGVKGIEDLGADDVGHLRGLATAIKEGDTTLDEALKPDKKEPEEGMQSFGKKAKK